MGDKFPQIKGKNSRRKIDYARSILYSSDQTNATSSTESASIPVLKIKSRDDFQEVRDLYVLQNDTKHYSWWRRFIYAAATLGGEKDFPKFRLIKNDVR